jgi:hypothetical protein
LRRWSNCTVEIFAPDGTLERREADCDVRLGERDIVISYFDDEGPLVFSGPNDGSGRFDLHCRSASRGGRESPRGKLERGRRGGQLADPATGSRCAAF